jgi:hypothetical protein
MLDQIARIHENVGKITGQKNARKNTLFESCLELKAVSIRQYLNGFSINSRAHQFFLFPFCSIILCNLLFCMLLTLLF